METTNGAIVPKEGWSWGAPMLNASYLIATKRYVYLWWFLLAFVPFLNFIFWIAAFVVLGLHGHGIAAKGTQFANQSEYDGFTRATDHAGKIMFFACIILFALFIVLFIAGFSFLGLSGFHRTTAPGVM